VALGMEALLTFIENRLISWRPEVIRE